ncbi:hypothetical protein [Stenotrophomonas rhizophila]|uniref:hypothetical protein n=1 Tax=Stenotrophomonas rhizophila TaxID=216778 RepID=UPI0028D7815B|nr:hypothetical protein [Stenotrophomonas rhizophila]
MAATKETPSVPKVLRIEAMPLDFGEAAVVIELEAEPPRRWFKALKREMVYAAGLETASAKFDGCFVYIVGLDSSLGSAVRCASRLLAAVQDGWEHRGVISPETSHLTADGARPSASCTQTPLRAMGSNEAVDMRATDGRSVSTPLVFV